MFRSPDSTRQKGVALLVVLSLVVIVCLILVAFVTAMRLERSASASYSQSIFAEQLARGAANLVIADFQKEMAVSAQPEATYPHRPVFTNVSPSNISPQKFGTNPAMPLLARTSGDNGFTNSSGAVATNALRGSTNSTASASKNGRFMSAERWSLPRLGSFPAQSVPSWIYVTRDGITNGQSSSFSGTAGAINNPSTANAGYALGRFAYAAYDIGGLLDVTVAGFPAGFTAKQIQSLKSTLAGVDLSALGLSPGTLVAWRNPASSITASNYVSWASAPGSISVGDTTFLGRMDLIKAAKAGTGGLNTNALTNLTVFSRERNAPSWRPTHTTATNAFAPTVQRSTGGTLTYYGANGTASTNSATAGDPVPSRRFSLAKLAWIGPAGPQNGGTATAIQACFGLHWNAATGIWEYVGATGSIKQSSIKTLAQIAAESPPREPDFFELLQAAIEAGSLGLEGHLSAGASASTFSFTTLHEKSTTLHVFRLGASILSQYDQSACPIVISYDQSGVDWYAAGIDNLPYINLLAGLGGSESATNLSCFLVVGLWNPHLGNLSVARPKVRLRIKGSIMLGNGYGNYSQTMYPWPDASLLRPGYTENIDATAELSTETGKGVNGFEDAKALEPDDLASSPGSGSSSGMQWASMPSIKGTVHAGFRLPDFVIDPSRLPSSGKPATYAAQQIWQSIWMWVNTNTAAPFNLWLEFQNPDGVWVPYNYFAGINDEATWMTKPTGAGIAYLGKSWANDGTPLAAVPQPWNPEGMSDGFYFSKQIWESPDPRSLRFNPTQHETAKTSDWSKFLSSSMWSSDTDPTFQTLGRTAHQQAQKIFGPPWAPASLCRNNNTSFIAGDKTSPASYVDPDGTRRLADSGLFSAGPATGGWKGDPFARFSDRSADRPVILNRPFYTVGELGYAFRDYPWKTLDLFTANSADGALLDYFTATENSPMVAPGKINLNSVRAPVLSALIANIGLDEIGGGTPSQPSAIATNIVQQLTSSPLSNKSEIASRLIANLPASAFGGEDEEKIKRRREAAARALSDVGQIRTWNFLIDVVAQAGKFPASATSLDDFNVEAEKRYWLHVAIDRFTGDIVDQKLEAVSQ